MTEIRSWGFWRAVAAEFVGMLLFIFIGISAIIGPNKNEAIAHELKVSLAFALAIATLAQSLGHVSGAHLNPAVTLGLLVSSRISALRCVCYILAQMLGAVAASAIVNGSGRSSSLGVNKINGVTVGQGFVIEFLATLQLVLCVIAVTDKRRADVKGSAPLAIGLSVGLGHFAASSLETAAALGLLAFLCLAGIVMIQDFSSKPCYIVYSGSISFTGCGINPARSFGPAVIRREFQNHWVYWLAPMCGGIAAALIYDFLLCPRTQDSSTRRNVLLNGPDENDVVEVTREGSPGPSQWPKQ